MIEHAWTAATRRDIIGRASAHPTILEQSNMVNHGPNDDTHRSMNPVGDFKDLRVLSVGHSNHTLETFIGLLKARQVDVLVDVRSEPYSKYSPHFSRDPLTTALKLESIQYVYLGKELGGRPQDDAFYDAEGHVRYDLVAKSSGFLDGIRRLENGLRAYRVAIMCSEEDPTHCHRRLLVTRVLESRGVRVEHLRADGRVQSETDLRDEEARKRGERGQMLLFDDLKEPLWRSSQSVSTAILSVGLTRAFSSAPGVAPLHWLQVNNIHISDIPLWQ